MKSFKKIFAGAVALVVLAAGAIAAVDDFYSINTIVATTPQVLTESGIVNVVTSNSFAIQKLEGICQLDIITVSNTATGTPLMTYSVNGSPNGTNNWNPLTNVVISTSQQIIYTNYFGTTNSAVAYYTNNNEVPGVISNAIPASQGFAGQYLVAAQLTNTAANITNTGGGVTTIGFNADDAPPYLQIVYTTGTNATYDVGAILRGHAKYTGRFF